MPYTTEQTVVNSHTLLLFVRFYFNGSVNVYCYLKINPKKIGFFLT